MVQKELSQLSGYPASSRPWTLTEELWSYIYPGFIDQPGWRLLNSKHFHTHPQAQSFLHSTSDIRRDKECQQDDRDHAC